jgi:hypothetical protein
MTTENGLSWKPTDNGWYQGQIIDNDITPGFKEFAKESRSRWKLIGNLKKLATQLFRKQNTESKQHPQ